MKQILILSIAILLNSCSSSALMPNNATQATSATGALAGALIGANTASGSGSRIVGASLIGGLVGAGVGSMVDKNTQKPTSDGGWTK